VDAVEVTTLDRQVAPDRRSAGQHDRVEVLAQLLGGDVAPHVDAAAELGAFGLHLLDAPVDVALLHLELGDAVAQQTTGLVVTFEHDHAVPRPGQLLRGRHAGRPGADDRDPVAGARGRRGRHDPALLERPLDDGDLDLLDRHRVVGDPQDARPLTGRRAQLAGELREVVGGVQPLDGGLPVVAVDQVVPVGDEVAQRTAVVAERDAAVHAAAGLGLEVAHRHRQGHLTPVLDPLVDRPVARQLTLVLEEPGDVAHVSSPSASARSGPVVGVAGLSRGRRP
jgi:hypothetical protein